MRPADAFVSAAWAPTITESPMASTAPCGGPGGGLGGGAGVGAGLEPMVTEGAARRGRETRTVVATDGRVAATVVATGGAVVVVGGATVCSTATTTVVVVVVDSVVAASDGAVGITISSVVRP